MQYEVENEFFERILIHLPCIIERFLQKKDEDMLLEIEKTCRQANRDLYNLVF